MFFLRKFVALNFGNDRKIYTLQTAGKPCSVPANSSYYRCILVFVGVNFQFFLHLFKNIFGSIRFGIRYNIAEIARAVFFRGIYKMHVRITESGDNTLPVTINNFCAVINPRFCAFVIADLYKFSIFDSKCLRMSFRAVQCNGINFCILVNFVRNF